MTGLKNKNISFTELSFYIVSIFIVVFTLFPFFVLCLYNHPIDHDNWWIFADYMQKDGYHLRDFDFFNIRGMFNFCNIFYSPLYNHYDGIDAGALKGLLRGYHLFALFDLILYTVSFTYLYYMLNKAYLGFTRALNVFVYSLGLFMAFCGLYYPGAAFYEQVSAAGYTTGLAYFFIYLALLIKDHNVKKSILSRVFILLFMYASSHSIEMYSFICGFFVFAFILYDFLKNRKINWFYTSVFLLCVGFFFIAFLSVRGSVLPNENGGVGKYQNVTGNETFISNFIVFIKALYRNLSKYFIELVMLRTKFIVPVYCFCSIIAYRLYIKNIRIKFIWMFSFILVVFGTAFILHFAIPDIFSWQRLAYIVYELFTFYVLAFIIWVELAIFRWFSKKCTTDETGDYSKIKIGVVIFYNRVSSYVKKHFRLMAILFVGVFSFFSMNHTQTAVFNAWKDILNGSAREYNSILTDRYMKILTSNEDVVYVDPVDVHLSSSFNSDIAKTPNYFCYDLFWGKKIRVKGVDVYKD